MARLGDPLSVSPHPGPGRERVEQLCSAGLADIGVDGSGVSVLSTRGVPSVLNATDPVAALIEDLQFTLGEGPGVDASASGKPVLVADLDDPAREVDQRWPMFTPEAMQAGVRAIFAFPIRIGTVAIGTLDLYRRTPGPLDQTQIASGLATVQNVGNCLLGLDAPQVDPSPAYPMTVHQAAGMVMVQLGSSVEVALVRLRASAYVQGISITELAAEVIAERRRFVKEDR
ncbi:ANTAR domain-containing protein [soil metagenome]